MNHLVKLQLHVKCMHPNQYPAEEIYMQVIVAYVNYKLCTEQLNPPRPLVSGSAADYKENFRFLQALYAPPAIQLLTPVAAAAPPPQHARQWADLQAWLPTDQQVATLLRDRYNKLVGGNEVQFKGAPRAGSIDHNIVLDLSRMCTRSYRARAA